MRFKAEIILASAFGGFALIGFILPILGYIFLFIAAVFIVDIIAIWRGYQMRFRFPITFQPKQPDTKKTESAPTSDPQERKRADWMTANLNRDRDNLAGCLVVSVVDIDWRGLRGAIHGEDPYIEIHFDIHSSSVLNFDIGKNWDGRIKYEDAELKDPPEVRTAIKQLERSDRAQFTLRQWFSDAVMSRINQSGGEQVILDFSKVNISVEAKLPDNSKGPTCRLPLPDTFSVKVPTFAELEALTD